MSDTLGPATDSMVNDLRGTKDHLQRGGDQSRHARLLALAMIGLMSERMKVDSASSLPNLDQAGKANTQVNGNRPKARLADRDFAEIGE